MNNGQLNTVSVPTVTLLVTQESIAPAVPLDGIQQIGGDFAGLLSGVQLLAEENNVAELRHAPQLLFKTGKDQVPPDAAESFIVDLLAQNYVSPAIIALPQSAGSEMKDTEKPDVDSDAAPLRSELPDVTSRMVLAAYSQPGRMPEVNLLTPLPVDTLQNVATAPASPAAISAPAVKIHAEHAAAALLPDPQTPNPAATRAERPVAPQAAEQNQQQHQNKAAEFGLPVEASAVAAEEVLFPPHSTAPLADVGVKEVRSLPQESERETSRAIPIISVPESKPVATPQNTSTDRTSEVNKLTQPPVDRLQNVAKAPVSPAVISAPVPPAAAAFMQEPQTPKPAATPAERSIESPVAEQNQQQHKAAEFGLSAEAPVVATEEALFPPRSSAPVSDVGVKGVHSVQQAPERETIRGGALVSVSEPKTATTPQNASSDRKSEVNKLAPPPVDRLQNVASKQYPVNTATQPPVDRVQNMVTEPELPGATAAPAGKIGVAQLEAASLKPASIMAENKVAHHAVEQNQLILPEAGGLEPVEKSPEVTVATVGEVSPRPQVQVATADTGVREVLRVQPPLDVEVITSVRRAVLTEPVTASPLQQDSSVRKSGVNKPTPLPDDTLKHVTDTAASKLSATFTALSEKRAATPAVAVPASHEQTSVSLSEPLTAASVLCQPETPSQPIRPVSTVPLESELDIQLSQPRPITVRAAAAAPLTDARPASLLPETRGVRQRLTVEQQNEKVRAGVEQVVVKEVAPLLQTALSASESTFGSSAPEGDSNQELPDGTAARNQTQAQDMQGQLGVEHQKVSAVNHKSVPAESVRQNIPEQVLQQVKERLVQHEVKAGNQQITLTLSPDSLGELKMNLNLQGQKLSVEIITESRSVRDAIVQHTDALKESLARQNITMDSFDVTTGGKGSGNQGPNQNAWRELAKQQQQQQLWTSPRGYNTAQADLSTGRGAYPKQQGHSMLDIHY